MRILALFFCLFIAASLYGQPYQLATGQWYAHLPYTSGLYVTQSESDIFYATEFSIMKINKADGGLTFISKVNGLSQTGVKLIRYHQALQTLIIVYDNSVIDLWQDGQITTLNQIRNFTNFSGDKIIADVFIENDSMVYLAANYGLSRLNVKAREFASTTFTGVTVRSIAVANEQIYAGTPEGVYTISTNNNIPEDFNEWTLLGEEVGLPMDYSNRAMTVFNGQLFFDVNHEIYRLDKEGQAQLVFSEDGQSLRYLTAEGVHLLAGFACGSGTCTDDRILYFDEDLSFRDLPADCIGNMTYAIETPEGNIYFADQFRDFRFLNQITDTNCNRLIINSPWNENSYSLTIIDETLWVAAGGIDQTFSNRFSRSGFYQLNGGFWTNYNPSNRSELRGLDQQSGNDDLLDFLTIAVRPTDGRVFAGSFFEGLIEFDGEQMTLYNDTNSSLQNAVGDEQRTRVSSLAFDEENNLWITNHAAPSPLSVFTNIGEWRSFSPSCNRTELHQLGIDANGFKWMIDATQSSGVLVFDEGDLNNPTDDRCRVFTEINSNLPSNQTNCLIVDLDGQVWVGTSKGIIIFECGADPFDERCQGSLRGFEEDGLVEPLLNTQNIQTIAIDGANRKWIGTGDGVFVLSEDGDEEIFRFTASNSPLFDNNILDIAVNDINGEVFIGTNKGIISYRSDAIGANRFHQEKLTIFPNPVAPDFDGLIAIQGLTRDAKVKITDLTGKLVYETDTNGGQAVWDGRDYNGRKVSTGVYLVFSASNALFGTNTKDNAIGKIVFIR